MVIYMCVFFWKCFLFCTFEPPNGDRSQITVEVNGTACIANHTTDWININSISRTALPEVQLSIRPIKLTGAALA